MKDHHVEVWVSQDQTEYTPVSVAPYYDIDSFWAGELLALGDYASFQFGTGDYSRMLYLPAGWQTNPAHPGARVGLNRTVRTLTDEITYEDTYSMNAAEFAENIRQKDKDFTMDRYGMLHWDVITGDDDNEFTLLGARPYYGRPLEHPGPDHLAGYSEYKVAQVTHHRGSTTRTITKRKKKKKKKGRLAMMPTTLWTPYGARPC